MSSVIIYTPNLVETLSNKNIIIDTCSIIEASKNDDFLNFLFQLGDKKCTFLSVKPVWNEFLAAADSGEEYKTLKEFLKKLDIAFLPNVEQKLNEEGEYFSIAMRRSKVKNPSYVDRLLLFVPYMYKHSIEEMFVMTSNHKDVPREFYDRVGFIVWDNDADFRQIGVYQLNLERFNKILQ